MIPYTQIENSAKDVNIKICKETPEPTFAGTGTFFIYGLILKSLYETFIHILLSNICKIKKEEKRLSYIHCARGEKHYEKTNR